MVGGINQRREFDICSQEISEADIRRRHTALKWVLWLQTRAARCPDTVPAVTVNRGMVPVFARLFRGHVAALQSKRVSPSAWPESVFIRARKFAFVFRVIDVEKIHVPQPNVDPPSIYHRESREDLAIKTAVIQIATDVYESAARTKCYQTWINPKWILINRKIYFIIISVETLCLLLAKLKMSNNKTNHAYIRSCSILRGLCKTEYQKINV